MHMGVRKLNVVRIATVDLYKVWNLPLPSVRNRYSYIRCNAKGVVGNIHTALIYDADELIVRGNYNVAKDVEASNFM